jgi:hypothetical protein
MIFIKLVAELFLLCFFARDGKIEKSKHGYYQSYYGRAYIVINVD